MGFLFMLIVTVMVFLVLRLFIGTAMALIIAIVLHLSWWAINKRAASKGLFKANIQAYLSHRISGASIEEALLGVVNSRYHLSSEKRTAVLALLETSDDPSLSEEERIKSLVYEIFCFENGPPPSLELEIKFKNSIDEVWNSLAGSH